MKKLLFAIAGAAVFSAFAADPDPQDWRQGDIDVLGFENFNLQAAGVTGAVVHRDDSGQTSVASKWSCAGDDASLVKTYGGENAPAPTGVSFPAPFADGGDNYLALDTNGSELQRAIPADGQTVAATGTYIDTLVQFTASEGAPTAADLNGAKLAIWLNSNSNLMVQAGAYDDQLTLLPEGASFALKKETGAPLTVLPGTWYRLTVKALPNQAQGEAAEEFCVPVFEIRLDGDLLAATTGYSISEEALESFDETFSAETKAAFEAGTLFIPFCAVEGDATLSSVGFKGTGALDDFVVTTQAPGFTPPAIDFTLTWASGVTPVSYTIDGGTPVSLSGETSPFAVPGLTGGESVAFTFTNADGATKTMTATAADDGAIDSADATYTWADYLGDAVNGAYTIDDANDLDMLRKGVAAGLATVGETFNQTANINMSTAGPFAGIGSYAANLNSGVSFNGTYDGQGYKISNVDFTQRNYGGVFNQVKGGTIKNLTVENITCSTFDSSANDGEWGCAIVGNAGLGATLQGLTAMGDFGTTAIPCSHNVAGIAIRVCGGASNVVNGVTMLETLVKDCTNNATLHGFYTKAAGITALTQDQNGVPNDYALFDGCVNNANIAMVEATGSTLSKIGRDGLSGILGYVADGTKIKDCVNNGTLTSALTTAKIGGIVGWAQGRTLDDLGGNKNPAAAKMVGDPAGSTITGFTYATVDNGVATTVTTLAKDTEYLLEGNAAPTFELAADGDFIAFNTALGYTLDGTGITAAEGLTLTDATESGVTTYTAAAQSGGDDYVVEIEGSDVVITPQEGDLEALAEAGVDTNSVAAVNAALATTIEGTSIPAWQALFLGVAPTTNGLEQVAIKSVSFDAEGKVVVEMADGVTLKTGRGVNINLILKASDDLTTWTTLQTATNTKEFTAVQPGLGETKKFYKVVVEFADPNAAQN